MGLFGVRVEDNVIVVGQQAVAVEFDGERVVASLNGFDSTSEGSRPQQIVDAVREVVAEDASYKQAVIDQRRAIEDARRILGGG